MKTKRHVPLDFIQDQEAWVMDYDGIQDDLLSGGSGLTGLKSKSPPLFKDPRSPTEKEIRKRTLWLNYRALMDVSDSYYGRYYGPGIGYGAPELIAGQEIMALMDSAVTVMLQIPGHFDPNRPYLITSPSSGSRGVYGGIGVVGEWALKRGFAVVYTDKGTGVGYHNLDTNRVCRMNGLFDDTEKAGIHSTFTVPNASKELLEKHRLTHPHRIGIKHAHVGVNHQKDWGNRVLQSIEFAKVILTELFPEIKGKLKVMACGISNGGLSSIMAKENDEHNLIDAIVVSEPNVTPVYQKDLTLAQGDMPPFQNHSKHLADYISLFNIYQPCASLCPEHASAPFRFDAFGVSRSHCENRCWSLKEKGLLKGETLDELARCAQDIVRASGTIPAQDLLLPSHYTLDVSRSIALTYISQYGGFSVFDHLCGYSFAPINEKGSPRALLPEEEALLFSDQSGIPPLGSIKLINDLDPEGPREDRRSISPSTGRMDMNLDGALRLRRLVTGVDEQGAPLKGSEYDMHQRVIAGMDEVRVKGNLKGCPSIIVTGRADSVLPVNHTSRPYVGVNRLVEKGKSRLHYYEVTDAHHVDALNMLYADPEKCKPPMILPPLHVFYLKALDLMVSHLETQSPLPPSQVIRPDHPRVSLPDIVEQPRREDRIRFENSTLFIPE
ncbi:MAG: D-(-)-3-hydroxybutyrate oligomer hydrolase [Proteobacteria bacterium]|nr:D-(-)-3-hydroxybutyrate oligomer hydrolase [Pseudomonadota bacterium]